MHGSRYIMAISHLLCSAPNRDPEGTTGGDAVLPNRLIMIGTAAIAAAAAMVVLATAPGSALAGAPAPTSTSTATSTSVACVTPTAQVQLDIAAQQAQPLCTSTPVIVRSATPSVTATEKPATNTAVVTAAANTPVPPAATATKAGGGAGGQVTGPNTGTGDATGGGGVSLWLIIAGAVLATGGAGAVAAGIRRR